MRRQPRLVIAAHRTAHIHRRRKAAADENLHLDAAILFPAFAGSVIGDRYRLAIPERENDPAQRDLMLLREVADHRVRAPLAQTVVHVRRAVRRREATHFDDEALLALGLSRDLIEHLFGFRRQHGAAHLEVDGRARLLFVLVERRYTFVGLVDALDGRFCRLLGRRRPALREVSDLGQFFDLARQALRILLGFGDASLGLAHAASTGTTCDSTEMATL